ncbi:hypothetical protein [Lentzea sp.]|uniref:hypothetical protein n=1 Tax=Lentzea sp. TaxID=56099 RepID=UPI002ED52CBA
MVWFSPSAFADDIVTSAEIASAINRTDAGNDSLVAEPVPSNSDADSAAVTTVNGVTVDVPKDLSDGVDLARSGVNIAISLPNADEAKDATKLADGTIAYPSTNGAANAVVPTGDGVQMLTTIANADAATRFPYKVDVPQGGRIELSGDGAVIVDAGGAPTLSVSAPWAKDATGKAVPSHFETDGTTLTQVIEHTSSSVSYPVVADPWWSWIVKLVKFTVKKIGPWALVLCATGAGWAWLRSDAQGWLRVGDSVVGCLF